MNAAIEKRSHPRTTACVPTRSYRVPPRPGMKPLRVSQQPSAPHRRSKGSSTPPNHFAQPDCGGSPDHASARSAYSFPMGRFQIDSLTPGSMGRQKEGCGRGRQVPDHLCRETEKMRLSGRQASVRSDTSRAPYDRAVHSHRRLAWRSEVGRCSRAVLSLRTCRDGPEDRPSVPSMGVNSSFERK